MRKFTWSASSNDGSFEDKGKLFPNKMMAYEDMRTHALEKMKWNTEWPDFFDMDEEDYIGYNVKFHPDYIIHESYSGIYTYVIHEVETELNLYGRKWEIIDVFEPKEMEDWEVADFGAIGKLWCNNYDGFLVLIEPNGRILKSYI